MDFSLTEDQKMVRETAREFAEKELLPHAARFDEEKELPEKTWKKLGELGFMGMNVPEEYGGTGLDYVSYALALIEISKACAATGVVMSACNSLYNWGINRWGTEEQKKRYLTPVASGEELGCFALTEADAGSDTSAIRTRAEKRDDGWVINGEKKFITNGNVAGFCVLCALTDPKKGMRGLSTLIVDLKNTEGFSVGRVEDKLGIRASGTAELVFQDARVPGDALLGREGAGMKNMLTILSGGRIGIAAQAVGIARAALELATRYSRERKQFGKPISALQAIQFKLADMATRIDAAELLTLRAAWNEDMGLPYEQEAAMAKMYASDVAMWATVEGVQVLGGYGYVKDFPMERYLRDAKITQIYEGTNEIMRLIIARKLIFGR